MGGSQEIEHMHITVSASFHNESVRETGKAVIRAESGSQALLPSNVPQKRAKFGVKTGNLL